MTTYIRLSDKTVQHPRCEMPHKDWPDAVPKSTLDVFGYALVFPSPKPSEDAIEGEPVLTSKGHWEQKWTS